MNADQIAALSAPLSRDHVKTRSQSGRNLSYIEGWVAIKEANRIFGFDAWSRQTLDLKCVSEYERPIGAAKVPGWGVTYIATVRITLGDLIREGSGTGHGIDRDKGQAHESALKEAETDAMKRALMTFGNPFGLALYDKEQTEVGDPTPAASNGHAAPQAQTDQDVIDGAKNWVAQQTEIITKAERLPELYMWLDDNGGNLADPDKPSKLDRLKRKMPDLYKEIVAAYQAKIGELSAKP